MGRGDRPVDKRGAKSRLWLAGISVNEMGAHESVAASAAESLGAQDGKKNYKDAQKTEIIVGTEARTEYGLLFRV